MIGGQRGEHPLDGRGLLLAQPQLGEAPEFHGRLLVVVSGRKESVQHRVTLAEHLHVGKIHAGVEVLQPQLHSKRVGMRRTWRFHHLQQLLGEGAQQAAFDLVQAGSRLAGHGAAESVSHLHSVACAVVVHGGPQPVTVHGRGIALHLVAST